MEQYNSSKVYKIGMFVLNNSATNLPLLLLMYYMFYTQNILGLSGVVVGIIGTSIRLFDGITDPIIGFFIDRTESKFGKFRPFMIAGNLIIVVCMIAIFNTPIQFSEIMKYVWTTGFYIIYIIGYTFQTACTKGGQVILTNNPKQRPLFSVFDSVYNTIIFTGGIYYLMSIVSIKYEKGLLNPELWKWMAFKIAILSMICTALAVCGIWEKDKKEFFGLATQKTKVKFKDYVEVIKNNKAIRMLTIAASTDKLGVSTMNGVAIYLFANLLLNQKLQGDFSGITGIPVIIVGIIGLLWSRKVGLKKAFVLTTWIGLGISLALYLVGIQDTFSTTLFIVLMFFQRAFQAVSGSIVIPMIADVADYELYRTGRFIPGMMGTLFSFIDKLVSSLGTTVIGFCLAYAGVSKGIIVPNTFINLKFNSAILFAYCIIPILGYIASIIAMKYYVLDKEKMEEIQIRLNEKRMQEK
ncbi:MAG: MFS transporter [Fusobacteriaceae bacterium]